MGCPTTSRQAEMSGVDAVMSSWLSVTAKVG
jgi:hypothetical protein